MKEFVKKGLFFLLYFIVFSVLINAIYYFIIAKTDWNLSKRIESINFVDPDFDLLVLGTSLAEYGIDAELLTEKGIKSYNLALDGSSIKTCYIQLEEYLSLYQTTPKYVLLPVNSFLERFDQDGIQPLVEFTMRGQKINFKDVPISKFQWQTTELIKKGFSKEYRSAYVSYGQTRRSKVVVDHSNYTSQEIGIDEFESADWIGAIAELCNKHHIELYVIETPGMRETQNISDIGPHTLTFENGEQAKLYNLNSQVFCEFIDGESDWCGLSHLNEQGAAKFTLEFLKFIQE